MSRSNGTAVAERKPASRGKRAPNPAPRRNDDQDERPRMRGSPGGGARGAAPGGPRPVWSGSISFGLVNIPVRLFVAVREKRVSFHLLHDQDKARLRRKIVSAVTGREVHPEHIVRGYPIAPDRFVIVRDEELEGCAPDKTRTIEITDFVDLSEIDPVYYDRPYYVVPQKGAARSYRLLSEAMRRSGKVGIARVVMHDKEYLAALRILGEVICLSTMHFGDEVVGAGSIPDVHAATAHVGDRELKAAKHVVSSLKTKFNPAAYHDRYLECVNKMVKQKADKELVTVRPAEAAREPQKAKKSSDLMAALEASLARARKDMQSPPHEGNGRRRKSE